MPHLVLEYTENLSPWIFTRALFPNLHAVVAATAGVDLRNCKSRSICHEDYWIGNGGSEHAFLHLEVSILEGRTPEEKAEIGRACLAVLAKGLAHCPAQIALQITVEVRDMQRAAYLKSEHPGR